LKNVKVTSIRRKWMNEEAWVAIHRRRLMNWRISRIVYEKKVDEWKSMRYLCIKKKVDEWKSTKYLFNRRRLMNEKAQSTYSIEEGWWMKKH
jgi:hypothetical protein